MEREGARERESERRGGGGELVRSENDLKGIFVFFFYFLSFF